MNPFTYTGAKDERTALEAITQGMDAKFIAGGTNLLDLMKIHVMRPDHLVDIGQLALRQIEDNEEGGLRLGALVTNAVTAYHSAVQLRYPLLSKAILAGASAQLRNMATNGGNLLQRTRCYYFYDTQTPCNKRDPGSGCGAIAGINRIHAILGHSEHCIATHPSDMAVALAALRATVLVSGPEQGRSIPMAEFHRLPGDTPDLDTNLAQDELITAIELPPGNFNKHCTYLKIRERNSYAFAVVSVAAALDLDGTTIREGRIALGGVAHKPWTVPAADDYLAGKEASRDTFTRVADILLQGAVGFKHNHFKIALAKRAIVRALEEASENTNE